MQSSIKKNLFLWFKNPLNQYLIVLSAFYSFVFNTPIYLVYYAGDYFVMAKAIFLAFLITLAFFIILSFLKYLKIILLPLFFLLGAAGSFFIFNYKVLINHNAIALMLETSSDEATGLMSGFLIGWIIFAFLLGVLLAKMYFTRYQKPRKNKSFLSLIILIPLFIFIYFIGTPTYYFFRFLPMPLTFITSPVVYAKENSEMKKLFAQKKDLGKAYPPQKELSSPLKVIVIIGEAARSSHFSINGYFKETSPKIKEKKVLAYPHFVSCSTVTRISVPCFMTRATEKDPFLANKETSFISLFKAASFQTFWISNQGSLGQNETPVSVLAKETQKVLYVNQTGDFGRLPIWDENLIPPLKEFLNQTKNQDSLALLHTIGSHWKYDSHYPDSFKVFKPTCNKNTQKFCQQEHVINSYDNSLLYTDFVISSIIDLVKDENALVFYVSDHGESLGEEGRYSHWVDQMHIKEQREAAFFVWASKQYQKNYPSFYSHLKEKQNAFLSHDHIFHSVVHCAGLNTQALDLSLSLCSPTQK